MPNTNPINHPVIGRIFSRGVFHDLFTHSWRQNIVVSAALLLLALAIGYYFMKDLRRMSVGFGAGTTILFWIVLLVLIRQIAPAHKPSEISTQSPPSAARPKLDFAVAVEAGWLHPKSMDENFWLVRGDKKGLIIVSPINGILYIRFTNLSDAPIMIDSYSIEILNGKQGWVRLVTIDAHSGEVYNRGRTNDMKQARRSNIEQDTFDYMIANKDIEPGHTVRGWVFVEAPKAGLEGETEARFNVRDVLGNKAVRSIQVLTGESQSVQPRVVLRVGGTRDLSQASRQFYSEANP